MRIRGAIAIIAGTLVWGTTSAQAQVVVNLVPGNINYQWADATTGQPITTLNIPGAIGSTARVAIYLVQTGGNIQNGASTFNNIFSQIGMNSLGVRLNYGAGTTVAKIPSNSSANMTGNTQGGNGFDFFQRDGSTVAGTYPAPNNAIPNYSSASADHSTNLATNAQMSESFLSNAPPEFPSTEDPLANPLRILVGTFTLQSIASGSQTIYAVDPFDVGNQNLTGVVPGGGSTNVLLDQFLGQNVGGQNVGPFPALTVTVAAVPEPGTMSLAGLAVAGLISWRRRRATALAA
jgi:hypothetical protein